MPGREALRCCLSIAAPQDAGHRLVLWASSHRTHRQTLSLTGLASSEYPNTNMSFLNTAWGLCFYSLAYRLGVSVSILLLIAVLFLGYLLV
jgi:hypothetical protein